MRRMRSALPSANIRSIGPGDTERSSDCRHRNVRESRLNFLSINLRGESASWGGSHVWVWRSLCAATKSARASERLDAHDARPNGLRSASQTFRMDGRPSGSDQPFKAGLGRKESNRKRKLSPRKLCHRRGSPHPIGPTSVQFNGWL
jgi:hypothetical protein